MNQSLTSIDQPDPAVNPYAPPRSDPPPPPVRHWEWNRLRQICLVQLVVMIVGLSLELFHVETILGTGPVYLLVGVITLNIAYRESNPAGILFGLSAILLTVGLFAVINVYSLGPRDADRPVTIIIWGYAALAIPCLLRAMRQGNGAFRPLV